MLSISEAQLAAWLSPVFWPFLRVLAMFTSAPVFSSRAFPLRAKIAFAFFVSVGCQAALPDMPIIGLNSPGALGAVVQQVVIGLSMGFAIRVVFASVELAGEVIGFQMGLNFAAFFDPALNSQSSAVARFFGQMTILIFIVLNGPIMVLMAVIKSFDTFPLGESFLEGIARMQIYKMGTDLFASALWIALPMVGIVMFTNMALGIISRVAPQMSIFSIGFPITLVAGLIGIAFTLPMLDQPFIALMERAIAIFGRQ